MIAPLEHPHRHPNPSFVHFLTVFLPHIYFWRLCIPAHDLLNNTLLWRRMRQRAAKCNTSSTRHRVFLIFVWRFVSPCRVSLSFREFAATIPASLQQIGATPP